jgi:hypothetical protein
MRPTERFLAILGDVVGSREVPDRAELQGRLRGTLRRVKAQAPWRQVLTAGPEINAGDELQVLLRVDPANLPGTAAVSFLTQLTEDLRPVRVVFGLGLGALSTGLQGTAGAIDVRELDGPCFHRARKSLETAKREGRWAVISGMPRAFQLAANSILRLTGDIRAGWTDRQFQVIRVRRTLPLQKDVARELDVSPSVISEVLSTARHDAVCEAEEAVVVLLNRSASPKSFELPGLESADDE